MNAARRLGVQQFYVFTTSAVRDAANRDLILDRVEAQAGVRPQYLTGEDEARLIYLAVRQWYGWSAGRRRSSTSAAARWRSSSAGTPSLSSRCRFRSARAWWTREFLPDDPPSRDQLAALRRHVNATLREVADRLLWEGVPERAGRHRRLRDQATAWSRRPCSCASGSSCTASARSTRPGCTAGAASCGATGVVFTLAALGPGRPARRSPPSSARAGSMTAAGRTRHAVGHGACSSPARILAGGAVLRVAGGVFYGLGDPPTRGSSRWPRRPSEETSETDADKQRTPLTMVIPAGRARRLRRRDRPDFRSIGAGDPGGGDPVRGPGRLHRHRAGRCACGSPGRPGRRRERQYHRVRRA